MFKISNEKSGIPTYIAMAGEKISPEQLAEDFAYVISSQGVFIKRNNFIYSGFFKCDGKQLGEVDTSIKTKFDFRIPWKLFLSIESLFEKIYDKYKSEVAVILFYNQEKKEWAYGLPQQTVTGSSVDYDLKKGCSYVMESALDKELDKLEGEWSMVGSIHSHASMTAFHSGTDNKDEFGFDGIHITIGKLNERNHEYACRLMFGKSEYKKNLEDVVCCPTKAGLFPQEIINKVAEPVKKYYQGYYGDSYDGWTYKNGCWQREETNTETPDLPLKYTGSKGKTSNTRLGFKDGYPYKDGIVIGRPLYE